MEIVKKKILFLVTQSEFGGAQRYIYEIIRGLDPEKYEFLVAAGEGDGELFRKCQMSNVKCQKLEQLKRAPWPWQILFAIKEMYDLLKKEKPDILFLCSTTAGLLGSIASQIYKHRTSNFELRTIYRIGGWAFRDPRPFWQNWIILLAEKITAPLKDKIVVNSEIDRQLALKYKIAPPEKIIKIYNGIDPEKLNFLSKEEARCLLKSEVNKPLVGCVANFYKTKGLEYLLEAVQMFDRSLRSLVRNDNDLNNSNNSNIKLVIIGEGRQRLELETFIKKYNLENRVFLVGRIPDAYKYLKAFDVFVLPSLKEGFPWVILEAIAAETPIVATRVGALPEILDEEFLVEPANAKALAKKISQMLKHPAIPKLKSEFTLLKMLEETEKLLRD